MTFHLRPSTPSDGPLVVDVWRRAVDATHDFLSAADRAAIDAEVAGFLPGAPLLLAVDAQDRPIGFMFVEGDHMEALFIDPVWSGKGVGRRLVEEALKARSSMSTDVNAQNAGARGFYARMGFREVGRSDVDGQGRPYPLVHLKR